jgi:hypothetical protein
MAMAATTVLTKVLHELLAVVFCIMPPGPLCTKIISVVVFRSLHSANFRGKKIRRRLPDGRNPVHSKSSGVVVTPRTNCYRLSWIPALNVTGEVAQLKNIEYANETRFTW